MFHYSIVGFEKLRAARVVNGFYGLIFLKCSSTNQVMQNLIPKLRQTSIISKKPGFLSEKLKNLTSSNHHRF